MNKQPTCAACGVGGHTAAQCHWNAPGALESIRLPEHGTTIALDEVLAGYLPDDREDVREVIEAYADIQARKAVMLFSGAGLASQGDACDWLENLEGDAWAGACEEIAGAVKRKVEGAQGEREAFEAWLHTFDFPPQLEGEIFNDERYPDAACFGQFVYDDHSTQRCWAAWQARSALAQPSPAPEPGGDA